MRWRLFFVGMFVWVFATRLLADPLLDQLAEDVASVSEMSGTFSQARQLAVLPLPLESSGNFRFDRQEGLVWQTLEPDDATLLITEQGVFQNNSETALSGSSGLAAVLLAIFSGQLERLSQQFSINTSGSLQDWQLLLTPLSESVAAHIESIRISGAETLNQVKISEPDGGWTRVDFVVDSLSRSR